MEKLNKFGTRVLPLCLVVMILSCCLFFPASAATGDTYQISGRWVFGDSISMDPLEMDAVQIPCHFVYWNEEREERFEFFGLYYDSYLFAGYLDSEFDSREWLFYPEEFGPEYYEGRDNGYIEFLEPVSVPEPVYMFLMANATYEPVLRGPDLFSADAEGANIFDVLGGISGWLVTAIGVIMPMFYTQADGLTFIGTLAVAALAFAVIFLVISIIRRFLSFRG